MASLDRTWCDFWRDCAKSAQCTRKLTDEIRGRAAKLGIPLSRFMDKPECHEKEEASDAKA